VRQQRVGAAVRHRAAAEPRAGGRPAVSYRYPRPHRNIRRRAHQRDGHPHGPRRHYAAGLAHRRHAGSRAALIWGVSATDPLTFAAVAALLLGVAITASVIPSLRVLRLDPATTLRHE